VPGGVLFGTQTAEALAEAIELFERERFDRDELAQLAAPFSAERFDREFDSALARGLAAFRAGAPVPAIAAGLGTA
jgi:hypothetical protein